MIEPADVQQVISRWWFDYDQARFERWPEQLTADVHFTCRTDTGTTAFEDFVRADVTGRDAVVEWQTRHRLGSPDPLRHHGTDVHVTESNQDGTARFSSYIWVTQISGGSPTPLSTAIVDGAVRIEDGTLRIAELHVVLDTDDSVVLSERPQRGDLT